MKWIRSALMTATAVAFLATVPMAQEHPSEHPKEHPEHPKASAESEPVTLAMLSQAIKDYVAADAELKGGSFLVYDPVDKKTLQLTLAKVHEDKLATLGDGVYFACADFSSADGKTYDLDIFMQGGEKGLQTSEIAVHKVDGAARYNWSEKDGVWSKVAVTEKK
jgi:hypothetical protein